MTPSRSSILAGLIVVLVGCGRSPVPATSDGAGLPEASVHVDRGPGLEARADTRAEARPHEAGPTDLRTWDGVCAPPCSALCSLVLDCGLYEGTEHECETACAAWGAPVRGCLGALMCGGSKDCQAAAACIKKPPLPDLAAGDLVASVKGTTISYTFKVCNLGQGASDAFTVDLYYNVAAAPKAKQPGDQSAKSAGLAPGDCAPFILQRVNTPVGTYQSWVQVDVSGVLAETDEANNVAGPVKSEIAAPAAPDLVVQQFDAQLVGSDLQYTAQVCNIGKAPAFLFRLDFYYNRLLAPGPLQLGDTDSYVLGLAAGACQTYTKTYKSVPVGVYASWAFADTLTTVAESDETNNVAGPRVTTVTASAECAVLCAFVTTCSVFSPLEGQQCLTWCMQMPATTRQCAVNAGKKFSCTDLKACNLPAKPPPPPSPFACLSLCSYMTDTCKLVPQGQTVTCIVACASLATTKLQCALDAQAKKQCLQVGLCLL